MNHTLSKSLLTWQCASISIKSIVICELTSFEMRYIASKNLLLPDAFAPMATVKSENR